MAIAKCGMHWSWDSPMWCSGNKTDENKKPDEVDKMCIGCPWYKGNKKEDDYDHRGLRQF